MREHFADRLSENWRPPACTRVGMLRRFLDLQTGSIWRDLVGIVHAAKGSLLDVGCGAQPYRVLIPPQVQYYGIDSVHAKEHFGYRTTDTIYYSGERWPIERWLWEDALRPRLLQVMIGRSANTYPRLPSVNRSVKWTSQPAVGNGEHVGFTASKTSCK